MAEANQKVYPRMMRIRQIVDAPTEENIPAAVRRELRGLDLGSQVKPGQSVAITVGSRGIANLPDILKNIVHELKALGAQPFLVPAMGSHGGGTAEGQQGIVKSYGITEATTGAPIRASMEVVQVGTTPEGVPVFCDRFAYEADHVAVVNRVRPHTDFTGEIQSGLFKMMMIGLGKHHGATTYHHAILNYSFDHIVRAVGQEFIRRAAVLFGLGIVENQRFETALIKATLPVNFMPVEMELLAKAKEIMPKLPFDEIDLLIIDEIGKNISGAGLDTNVVGRKFCDNHAIDKEWPKITRIYVRDLTEETHGNAAGIGLADFTHSRVVRKMDQKATFINCITGYHPSGAKVPIHYDTDREVLDVALRNIGYVEPENARMVWIKNTLQVHELLVADAFSDAIRARNDLEVVEAARPLEFNADGNLPPL